MQNYVLFQGMYSIITLASIFLKVWAYLLGVGYNGQNEKFPRISVDILPSTPAHYYKLYQRYHELFKVTTVIYNNDKLSRIILLLLLVSSKIICKLYIIYF